MPIRYDAVLLTSLAAELEQILRGSEVDWIDLDQATGSVRLVCRRGPAVCARLGGDEGYIVLCTPGKPPEKRLRTQWRGLAIGVVTSPPDDRRLLIALDAVGEAARARILVLELYTNGWNALLLGRESNRIENVLWSRDSGGRTLRRGADYRTRVEPRLWTDKVPTLEDWVAEMQRFGPDSRRSDALRRISWLSSINVDSILGRWATDEENGSAESLKEAYRRYVALRAASPGEEAWLLPRHLGPQPYPLSLGEEASTRVPSLMEAMLDAAHLPPASAGEPSIAAEEDPETIRLRDRLSRAAKRAGRRAAALSRELESAVDEPDLRQRAQLLLAHKNELRKGQTTAALAGFDGSAIEIELDPTLGPIENAERLFDEARRRDRARAQLPALIKAARTEASRLESALDELSAKGPSEAMWRLAGGRREEQGSEATPDEPRLPYRVLRSTGGLEIRIGRGARENDQLTQRHSAPEDIWMHARQSPGAHVILRWGRRDQNPPHADLVEAAIIAALNSEARHSGTVAVDWTRRKYVRKPRKAAPGSVIPERVKTLFVEPDPDLPARLARST